MRIRIALGTAVAVVVVPAAFFALFSSPTAASARLTRPEAVSQHPAIKINDKLMSYAQARQVAKLATFYNAVTAEQQATFYKDVTFFEDVAFLRAVAAEQQAAAEAAAVQAAAEAAAVQAARAAAAAAAAPAPAAVATPAVASAPVPAGSSDATSTNTADWACIRQHESGDNYADGNGGAYQFQFGTWQGLTGLPSPAQDYPASVQDSAALQLFAQRGWEPWTTRYVCGL